MREGGIKDWWSEESNTTPSMETPPSRTSYIHRGGSFSRESRPVARRCAADPREDRVLPEREDEHPGPRVRHRRTAGRDPPDGEGPPERGLVLEARSGGAPDDRDDPEGCSPPDRGALGGGLPGGRRDLRAVRSPDPLPPDVHRLLRGGRPAIHLLRARRPVREARRGGAPARAGCEADLPRRARRGRGGLAAGDPDVPRRDVRDDRHRPAARGVRGRAT